MNEPLGVGAVLAPLRRLNQWRRRRQAKAQGLAYPLEIARVGETVEIVGLAGEHEFEVCPCFRHGAPMDRATCLRILEMGLVPGVRVQILGNGDPLILALWGGRTALSRSLAREIFVVSRRQMAAAEPWRDERAA
jgi:Fe2+ transport system protein FeoA